LRLALAAFVGALVLSGQAHAAVPRKDWIELRPPGSSGKATPLGAVVEQWQSVHPVLPHQDFLETDPTLLPFPEQGPEGLDLRYQLKDVELLVGADMGASSIPITPRADGKGGETYFWLRASFAITDRATVFVESFQGASSILGSGRKPPRATWDGLQITPGVAWRFGESLILEGGPVIYTMSGTGKSGGVGGRICLSLTF
jgi:hypothetical protein